MSVGFKRETHHEYSMIILLHLPRIPSPAHFLCGLWVWWAHILPMVKNRPFYSSSLTATTS